MEATRRHPRQTTTALNSGFRSRHGNPTFAVKWVGISWCKETHYSVIRLDFLSLRHDTGNETPRAGNRHAGPRVGTAGPRAVGEISCGCPRTGLFTG